MKNGSAVSNCHHYCTEDEMAIWSKCSRSSGVWRRLSQVSSFTNQTMPGSDATCSEKFIRKDPGLMWEGVPPWSSGNVLDHRLLPPVFEYRRGHIWRVFHLWLRFIIFGGGSAHLAYHVHKSDRKTPIIIIVIFSKRLITDWNTFIYMLQLICIIK